MSAYTSIRLLVMEDDPGQARLAQETLQRAGYAVDLARDGETGLAMYQTASYNLLIVDHQLPDISGLDVLRRLADQGDLPPTIMVTGHGDETIAVEAMKLGAVNSLVKDVDGSYLMLLPSEVERLLVQKRLEKHKRQEESVLQQRLAELELQFSERTTGLQHANMQLLAAIGERQKAEAALAERDARAQAILETAVEGILTIDERGIIESLNPAAERLFGYTAAEVVGQNVRLLMPSPYREAHDGYIAHYLHTGERKIIGIGREVVGQRKDGTTFPMDLAVSEVRLRDRRVFTGFVRDLTRRQQAEATQRYLAAIVESSNDAIIGETLEGTISSWNRGAERIYGYTAADVLGQPIAILVPPDLRDEVPWMLEHLKRGGRIEHFETQRLRQDGRRIDVSLTISPICDEAGRPLGISKTARDITARKRAEQEMQRADRLALVGQLASGLAHEIGTPLNVIAGNAELLRHDLRAQGLEVAELETIVVQADRITRLMERLLAFARAKEQPKGPLSLSTVLSNVLHLLAPRFRHNAITVVVEVSEDVPLVLGVADQLEQVCLNVLVNAWHAISRGGAVTIRTATPDDQHVQLTFRDTGCGMPPEALARACEPFYTTKGEHGTGLGLAICRQILDSHRGTLHLDSVLGEGTTVTVTLPRAEATGQGEQGQATRAAR